MRRICAFIFLAALTVVFTQAALAGTEVASRSASSVTIPRVTKAPTLQQFIDGTPREAEATVTNFIQREPHDGEPASRQTTAYLSYDETSLYVAFYCKEDPAKIRKHLGKREELDNDDFVIALLDTFHDHRRAYEFYVTAAGVQADGLALENANDDMTWDAVWKSEAKIVKDGYVVLMSLPFKSMRFNRTPVQEWGIFLARRIPDTNEIAFWPHMTRKLAGFGTQMGHLEGMENVSPGRNLQFIPYTSFATSRSVDLNASGGPRERRDYEPRGGLDTKLIIKDALTLDATINPDFSQVESDEPQATINQRFENYYEEKRPFFLDNSDIFRTPQTLFFSRRIADPEYGVRLTGRMGKWSFGVLGMDDRAAGHFLDISDPAHDARAKVAIGRVQRDFGNANHLAFMTTSRDFVGSFNRVFSLDSRMRFGKKWTWTNQAFRTIDHDLNGKDSSGNSYYSELNLSDRDIRFSTRYLDNARDLKVPMGYVTRTDVRWLRQQVGYIRHPKKGNVLSFGPTIGGNVYWDHNNKLIEWLINPWYDIQFPRNTEITVERVESFETYQNLGFRQHITSANFSTDWFKWMSLSLGVNTGTAVNYSPATGAPTLARNDYAMSEVTVKPTSHLRIGEKYIYWRLATLENSPSGSHPIFNNHIMRTKVNYQFTPRLSVRTIIDYNAVLPNPAYVTWERAKKFTGDVLVTYMVNPGTALYVGYTDVYDNFRLDPTATDGYRRIASPTTSTGRQFFVKLSYLFRF